MVTRATRAMLWRSAAAAALGLAAAATTLIFTGAFNSAGFPPRWYCGQWSAPLGWTHIISDVLIWLAYTAIPVVIAVYLYRRDEIVFPRVGWLFAAFILACGSIHLVEAVIFYWPIYRFSAVLKAVTAVVSCATVVALLPVLPKALSLPSRFADFKTLIENAPTAMLVVDHTGGIMMINAAGRRLFGYTGDQLADRRVEELVPPRLREELAAWREMYFKKPRPLQLGEGRVLTAIHSDGREIPVELAMTPLRLRGRQAALACIVDQTVQKERRERELAELGQALSLREMLGGLAHELNTPAQQIVTWAAVADQQQPQAPLREALDGLNSAAHDVGRIIHQLRNATVRREAIDQPTDLNEIIRDTLALMHREVTGVRTQFSDALPTVMADPVQLQLVLANLIRNAHEAGGPVSIATDTRDGEVTCRIDDRRRGFEGDLKRLFDPLYSTTPDGMGMGLVVSQAIVRRYGGRIVAARLDDGARFEFTLPGRQPTATV